MGSSCKSSCPFFTLSPASTKTLVTWPATLDLMSTFSRGCTLPVSSTSMARSPRLTVVISDGSISRGPAPPRRVMNTTTALTRTTRIAELRTQWRLRAPLAMVHSDGEAERRLQLVPLELQLRRHGREVELGVGEIDLRVEVLDDERVAVLVAPLDDGEVVARHVARRDERRALRVELEQDGVGGAHVGVDEPLEAAHLLPIDLLEVVRVRRRRVRVQGVEEVHRQLRAAGEVARQIAERIGRRRRRARARRHVEGVVAVLEQAEQR